MFKRSILSLFVAFALPIAPSWAAKGSVEITSEPGGAKVFIDNQRKGSTPTQPNKALVLQLEEGEYKLEGKTDDGALAIFDLYLAEGSVQPVHLILQRPIIPKPPIISERYQDNNNGTITDIKTNLVWMRCSLGQTWDEKTCTGNATEFTWEQATQQRANFAGHTDWRLPTINELQTLTYCSTGKPDYFPTTVSCQGDESKLSLECKEILSSRNIGMDKDKRDLYENCRKSKDNYDKPTIVQAAFPNTPPVLFFSSSRPDGNFDVISFNSGAYQRFGYALDGYVRLVRK